FGGRFREVTFHPQRISKPDGPAAVLQAAAMVDCCPRSRCFRLFPHRSRVLRSASRVHIPAFPKPSEDCPPYQTPTPMAPEHSIRFLADPMMRRSHPEAAYVRDALARCGPAYLRTVRSHVP